MTCQIFTMYALRAHYTIDMIGGILMGHYLFIISERYVYIIDYYIFGIPLEKRLGTLEQNQNAKQEKINALNDPSQ